MGYREIAAPDEVAQAYDAFVDQVREGFAAADPEARRRACRELLADLYFPGQGGYEALRARASTAAARAAIAHLDPAHATLEHEHYQDIDPDRYDAIKPMIWFWIMFDRSPAGRNCALGFRVRQALAELVFRSAGEDLRIFHDVEFTWGYNLEVGAGTTLHRGVFLDDRGGLELGAGVSISDHASVFTHTHDVEDIDDVTCWPTTLGDGARITYHATVLAGAQVGADGMVAACGLATRSVPAGWVWGGVPARPLKEKAAGRPPGGADA